LISIVFGVPLRAAVLGILALGLLAGATRQRSVRGLVLGVDPVRRTVVLRPISATSTDAPTAAFRISANDRARLRPGMTIDATIDEAAVPPTLSAIRIAALQPLVATPEPHLHRRDEPIAALASGAMVPAYPLRAADGATLTIARCIGRVVVVTFDADASALGAFGRALRTAPRAALLAIDARPPTAARARRVRAAVGGGGLIDGVPTDPLTIVASMEPAARTTFANALHLSGGAAGAAALLDSNGRYLGTVRANEPEALHEAVDAASAVRANPIARLNLRIAALGVALFGERAAGFASGADAIVTAAILSAFLYAFVRIGRAIYRGV